MYKLIQEKNRNCGKGRKNQKYFHVSEQRFINSRVKNFKIDGQTSVEARNNLSDLVRRAADDLESEISSKIDYESADYVMSISVRPEISITNTYQSGNHFYIEGIIVYNIYGTLSNR